MLKTDQEITEDATPLLDEIERKEKKRRKSRDGNRAAIRAQHQADLCRDIAVLDFETDPFDAANNVHVYPFVACLYWHDPMDGAARSRTIWDNNWHRLVDKCIRAILDLPGEFTVYAHNGGKFDWLYFLHRLRGAVLFKGRSLMSAKIGPHELRDSTHIIPAKLADFQKDSFNYAWMHKSKRKIYKNEIKRYLLNDCKYLYKIVRRFVQRNGRVMTIGSAALKGLRDVYKFEKLNEVEDTLLRRYFFGGRVECLRGAGIWRDNLRLYDVNSMYPAVMADFKHPIGKPVRIRTDGRITDDTFFITLTCDSRGAFLRRRDQNNPEEFGDTINDAPHGRFTFDVTIHEYEAAARLGLIRNSVIHRAVDFGAATAFDAFVIPRYRERERLKKLLDSRTDFDSPEYLSLETESLLIKLDLNNAYGKFAQDPRRFKECIFTDADAEYPPDFEPPTMEQKASHWDARRVARETGEIQPEWPFWGYQDYSTAPGYFPQFKCDEYAIWERKSAVHNFQFNNVATAASITGAARARLLRAIASSVEPYYCDTDSLICRELGDDVEVDKAKLGAWKLEAELSHLAIAGKKQYAYRTKTKIKERHLYWPQGERHLYTPVNKTKVKQKGATDVTFEDIAAMVHGATIQKFASIAPRIGKDQAQIYIKRNLRATAQIRHDLTTP